MNVNVYTKQDCTYCTRTKKMLDANGVEYTEINIEDDPVAKRQVTEVWGFTQVPVVETDNDVFSGWKPLEVSRVIMDYQEEHGGPEASVFDEV